MIPSANKMLTTALELTSQPSIQHEMQLDTKRIIGVCDGLDALKQTVFKILNTERYAFIIYSWNYGVEFVDLFGQPAVLVCPEIERRISDALMQDDRIKNVDSFEFDFPKQGVISVSFRVHSIFGDYDEETAVSI